MSTMEKLVTQERNAHWYRKDTGEPCHKIIGRNGKERAPFVREAKEMGLVPSVTSVLYLYPKPALDDWKIEQGILSALTLPRLDGESDDAFAKRVVDDSQSQAKTAAEFGSRVHAAIEVGTTYDPQVVPYLNAYREWEKGYVHQVIFREQTLINPEAGYAGTCDMCAEINVMGWTALIDFKCRNIKDPNKPPFYETDLIQLAAYAACNWDGNCGEVGKLISVVINSQKPEPPYVKVWDESEYKDALEDFMACLNLWKRIKRW